MKALIIGDPHFREGFVSDMEIFIEGVLGVVDSQRGDLDMIVVLGDVMDRHGILHQKPFHQACRFLIELSKRFPTYCLIGNHDFDIPSKYLPENHPFKVMTWSKIPNLTIVDKPLRVGNVAFIPYVPPGMFARALSEINVDNLGLIFAHQEFLGCKIGRLVSEVGDPWPMEDFGKHPFVVSGHIHDYQMHGQNIMYTGTPIQVNYGESEKKGICKLDIQLDSNTGLPKSKSTTWFKIRVPKKVSKTISIDDLDSWVEIRLHELCERYGLEIKFDKTRSKKQSFLTRLIGNSDQLLPLEERVREDRFLDKLKLQISVEKTTAGIRTTVNSLRQLPLGIQNVFIVEASGSSVSKLSDVNPIVEKSRNWIAELQERVSKHPNAKIMVPILQGCLN